MKKRVLFFFLLLIAGGCNKTNYDKLIFANVCPLPCWANITPGVSTEADIKEKEDLIPAIDNTQTAWSYPLSNYDAVFSWSFLNSEEQMGWIFVKNGIVESIDIEGGYSITLEEIINTYGEPQYVIIGQTILPHAIGLAFQNQTNLIYEKDGLIVSLKPNKQILLKSSIKIDRVIFFNPIMTTTIIDKFISPGLLGNTSKWDWQGYGLFSIEGKRK